MEDRVWVSTLVFDQAKIHHDDLQSLVVGPTVGFVDKHIASKLHLVNDIAGSYTLITGDTEAFHKTSY